MSLIIWLVTMFWGMTIGAWWVALTIKEQQIFIAAALAITTLVIVIVGLFILYA